MKTDPAPPMVGSFGWVQISRRAVDDARRALDANGTGVLDEVGFLALHRGYSDRFFPGTSVLHTRLRYLLFVPWLLDDLLTGAHQGRVDVGERWLLGKLLRAGHGVIGRDVYQQDRLPRQLSHEVYWNALGAWGIFLPSLSGGLPRRRALLSRARARAHDRDEDDAPLDGIPGLLRGLPARPEGWRDGSLDFRLGSDDERTWLADRLASARFRERATVLTALVERDPEIAAADLFSVPLAGVVPDDELPVLDRADRAASMAALGRAVYAALVERMWAADGRPAPNLFAPELDRLRERFGTHAAALDPALVDEDVGGLPRPFLTLIGHLRAWLRSGRDVMELYDVFEAEERRKKKHLARLPRTSAARARRAEWVPDAHPMPERLHYRWGNVKQLLTDLREGA